MRKFKHKKTGEILQQTIAKDAYRTTFDYSSSDVIPKRFVEDNNDWEEIIEKNYEILSFIATKEHGTEGHIIYIKIITKYGLKVEQYLNNPSSWKIYSVKRLSDGEIFRIGDILNVRGKNDAPLKWINLINNELTIGTGYGMVVGLNEIQHSKKPLFTTEDGVDIFQGMDCYSVIKEKFELGGKVDWRNEHPYAHALYFSTEQAAENYIIENKPCLSFKDLVNANPFGWDKKELIKLIKNKLNL